MPWNQCASLTSFASESKNVKRDFIFGKIATGVHRHQETLIPHRYQVTSALGTLDNLQVPKGIGTGEHRCAPGEGSSRASCIWKRVRTLPKPNANVPISIIKKVIMEHKTLLAIEEYPKSDSPFAHQRNFA